MAVRNKRSWVEEEGNDEEDVKEFGGEEEEVKASANDFEVQYSVLRWRMMYLSSRGSAKTVQRNEETLKGGEWM